MIGTAKGVYTATSKTHDVRCDMRHPVDTDTLHLSRY